MNTLIVRLQKVSDEAGGKSPLDAQRAELEKDWDDFTKLRKKIAAQVKEVRRVILFFLVTKK